MRALRKRIGPYGIVVPFTIVLAFPFYWMVMTSFKGPNDLYNLENNPYKFNQRGQPGGSPTLDNYETLFRDTLFLTWVKNTFVVGGVVVLITLLLAVPAGYALARLTGRWGQTLAIGIFLTYLVPPTLLFLPMSRLITELGLDNSKNALMLVYPSFTVPFATWLMMGFFKTIPPELEEAALVDGASRLKSLVRIVFPVSLPGILTVVIFTFSLCVNEFVYAVTFISTTAERTVSVGVPTDLIRGDVYQWGALMAGTILPAIPLALLYNAFLNRFIAGFTGGAFR
jgi:multiple sugar transport system permease protein